MGVSLGDRCQQIILFIDEVLRDVLGHRRTARAALQPVVVTEPPTDRALRSRR